MRAKTDVVGEIARMNRLRARIKIFGRTDDTEAQFRPDANRNHVLRQLFAQADTRVKPVLDDVDEAVGGDDLKGAIRDWPA